ncbi:hypothetical protein [Thalassotalea maritima]|uniref:hypothetical protein n=1 Tax=Thalassotalea maritima TaxID=3242416 RepID=UPI0035290746
MATSALKTLIATYSSLILATMLSVTTSYAASLSGTIEINGVVPSETSLTTTTTAEATLNPLGQGYTDRKVGTVVIKSNSAAGFMVLIESENQGYIAKPDATGSSDRLGYTLTLTNPQGIVGEGLRLPPPYVLINLDFKGVNPKRVPFVGKPKSPTSITYDVTITTPANPNLLVGENYSDTITLSMVEL